MTKKKAHKADHRADTRGGRWIGIPLKLVQSPAYRDLSMWERAVLVELTACMNGYNNGTIVCTFDQLTERLGNTNRRAMTKAIAALMEHGFVDVTGEADWKGRRGREYRLTFVNTTPAGKFKAATNDYKDWVKPKQKAGKPASPEMACFGKPVSLIAAKAGKTSSPNGMTLTEGSLEISQGDEGRPGNTSSPLIYNHIPISCWWACQRQMAVVRILWALSYSLTDVPDQNIARGSRKTA